MNFPNINRDECPTAEASQCGGIDDQGGGGGPDSPYLILEPGFAILCDTNTIQFSTFLATSAGQQQLTSGVTYSSSDPTILIIDSASGSGTKVGQGIVTVTATWRDLIASAQITCGANGDCCAAVHVQLAVLRDRSASMFSPFGSGTKDGTGLVIVKHALASTYGGILTGPTSKDTADRIEFSAAASVQVDFVDDYGLWAVNFLGKGTTTNIQSGFDLALTQFTPGTQQVILVVSDGQEWPDFTTDERAAFMAEAQAFKDGGGLIICLGIAANQRGFGILQQLSSGGFFINVHEGDLTAQTTPAIDLIKGLLCLACAGDRGLSGPGYGYGYSCSNHNLPGAQSPDPNAPTDPESGEAGGGGGGGDLPQLPLVQFSPPTGTDISTGINVSMSIPGYPGASIRYSMTTDGSDPPPPSTGYIGPVHISTEPTGTVVKFKAQASELGYNDSNISTSYYVQGASTNGLPIIWANGSMAPASPYPSVAIVSGVPGLVTSVKVKLKNINAQLVEPKGILLVGPDGTTALLLYANLRGDNLIPPATDITFDQTASQSVPFNFISDPPPHSPWTPGSYLPTVEASNVSFPAPAPAAPYGTSLAAFNGKNPNGNWSLYVIHVNFYTLFGLNHIDGGWQLILTTA